MFYYTDVTLLMTNSYNPEVYVLTYVQYVLTLLKVMMQELRTTQEVRRGVLHTTEGLDAKVWYRGLFTFDMLINKTIQTQLEPTVQTGGED